MKTMRNPNRAFTLVELIVVLAVIGILAASLLPALARGKSQTQRLSCSNNLKQVALAFRTWAIDHDGNTPMSLPSASGGNADIDVGTRVVTATQIASRGVSKIFLTLSNQLTTPKILFCPAEYESSVRQQPATFAGINTSGTNVVLYTNDLNMSYFIGVDAKEASPRMFLTGDHNLGSTGPVGGPPPTAFQTATTASQTPCVSLGTNFPPNNASVGWMNNMHVQQGNVALADASVEFFSRSRLQNALKNSGDHGETAPGYFPVAGACSPANFNRIQLP